MLTRLQRSILKIPRIRIPWLCLRLIKLSRRTSGANFSKVPVTFLGPKANFVIKACWIVVQFLAHKLVNFASDSHCTIFKIIDTLILNANMANIKPLFGPENLLELSRNVPLVTQAKLTSKQPYFHARNQFILETWSFRVSWQKIHWLQRSVLELPTMKQNKYNALTVWKSSGSRKRRNWKTSGTKKAVKKGRYLEIKL